MEVVVYPAQRAPENRGKAVVCFQAECNHAGKHISFSFLEETISSIVTLSCTYILMFEEAQHLQLTKYPLTRNKVLEDIRHLFESNSLSVSGVSH